MQSDAGLPRVPVHLWFSSFKPEEADIRRIFSSAATHTLLSSITSRMSGQVEEKPKHGLPLDPLCPRHRFTITEQTRQTHKHDKQLIYQPLPSHPSGAKTGVVKAGWLFFKKLSAHCEAIFLRCALPTWVAQALITRSQRKRGAWRSAASRGINRHL